MYFVFGKDDLGRALISISGSRIAGRPGSYYRGFENLKCEIYIISFHPRLGDPIKARVLEDCKDTGLS